jgi:hypothetical protein
MCYNPAKPSIVSIRTHASSTIPAFKVIARSPLETVPARTVFWYILRELILHDAFYVAQWHQRSTHYMLVGHTTKLLGSMILSAHVPGQPEVAYELPAQSPQNVISRSESISKERSGWPARLTKDNGMICEKRQRIATSGRQLCRRFAPGGRIRGFTIRDILGYSITIEVPWEINVSRRTPYTRWYTTHKQQSLHRPIS